MALHPPAPAGRRGWWVSGAAFRRRRSPIIPNPCIAGDLDGARGRSLFVRLLPPGTPGKFTDAATGKHCDLLDIIRRRVDAPTLRTALDEASSFLAPPAAPATGEGDSYDATEATRHRRYPRGALPPRAGLARCRFAALRFHPELRYREGSTVRRLPALVAAVTGYDGTVTGVQRTWLDPRSPAKAGVAAPRKALGRVYGHAVRFGRVPIDDLASLVVGEGIETVLSLVTAVPIIDTAAALSAGSLGAFAPPPGVARLIIARDNDIEGEQAAERLARRCARAGGAAFCLVPQGGDFNDDLVALGRDALAARLAHLFGTPHHAPEPSATGASTAPLPREGPHRHHPATRRTPRLASRSSGRIRRSRESSPMTTTWTTCIDRTTS